MLYFSCQLYYCKWSFSIITTSVWSFSEQNIGFFNTELIVTIYWLELQQSFNKCLMLSIVDLFLSPLRLSSPLHLELVKDDTTKLYLIGRRNNKLLERSIFTNDRLSTIAIVLTLTLTCFFHKLVYILYFRCHQINPSHACLDDLSLLLKKVCSLKQDGNLQSCVDFSTEVK